MRWSAVLFVMLDICAQAAGQQPAQVPGPTVPDQSLQTETVQSSQPVQAAMPAGEGFMEPAQVKEILQKVWLAEYRLNDLLTQVKPERWKLDDSARRSFQQTFDALRSELKALEDWRGQLDTRTDSMYLGYMTHATIDAVLPRLDAVTRMVSSHENVSLGAQFSQVGNQLFDLQQALQPYLVYLLRNQDQLLRAAQGNLASCQNELSYAMRSHPQTVTPMKNIRPDFKGRRKPRPKPPDAGKAGTEPAGATSVKKP